MPKISVLMSAYNCEKFVGEAIECVLKQTFTDFELIIINDGSSDNTLDVINSYNDNRIKLYSFNENRGVGYALNFGLSKVTGNFVAKFDADDISSPLRLKKQFDFLENNRNIDIVQTFVSYFPNDEAVKQSKRFKYLKSVFEKQLRKVTTSSDISEKLFWFCCVIHGSIMGRSEVIKKVSYNEKFRFAEDYKLFYKLNKLGHRFETIQETLVQVRVYDNSTSALEHFRLLDVIYQIKKEEIDKFFNNDHRKVLIWGAGEFGKNLNAFLKEKGFIVNGFVDSNMTNTGLEIDRMSVDLATILIHKSKDFKVLVASTPGKFEISKLLSTYGYRHLKDYIIYG